MRNTEDLRNQTISWGTLNPIGYVPKFLAVLKEFAPEVYRRVTRDNPELLDVEGHIDDRDISFAIENLFDAMDEIAPEGCTFRSLEGDGTDFGYWEEELEFAESRRLRGRMLRESYGSESDEILGSGSATFEGFEKNGAPCDETGFVKVELQPPQHYSTFFYSSGFVPAAVEEFIFDIIFHEKEKAGIDNGSHILRIKPPKGADFMKSKAYVKAAVREATRKAIADYKERSLGESRTRRGRMIRESRMRRLRRRR